MRRCGRRRERRSLGETPRSGDCLCGKWDGFTFPRGEQDYAAVHPHRDPLVILNNTNFVGLSCSGAIEQVNIQQLTIFGDKRVKSYV